jgi:hypothetical protein
MLIVVYADCHYAEYRTQSLYAECRSVECRGAQVI